MVATISPSLISGTIHAPASKSSMQRACALALLNKEKTTILNPGNCNDDFAALEVIKQLGAQIISNENNKLIIRGVSFQRALTSSNKILELNCGESGLGLRMFAPIAALNNATISINGSGSLLTRPMDFFDEVFPQLSIKITSNNCKLPIQITGPLTPKSIEVDGSLSSQFLTGLLIAFAKSVTEPTTISVRNLKSKPYIDLTLAVMKHFGYEVENNNYQSFIIHPKTALDSKIIYQVEGDWSSASFLLVAGAIAGKIKVEGLNPASTQADKAILNALQSCNANFKVNENSVDVEPSELCAFTFDATHCPDLFPPLVALASFCNGTTTIKGVSRLAHKESNRGVSLQEEFKKMGVAISLENDLMHIERTRTINGANVHSHHDHRIAMACTVAGLKAIGNTIINGAEVINKSYPDFYTNLQQLGTRISFK